MVPIGNGDGVRSLDDFGQDVAFAKDQVLLILFLVLGAAEFGVDDFVAQPWEATEVATRMKQALWRLNKIDSKELIKCGDLVIDLGKCEVFLSGKSVVLTFKEYELLKFLASNKGRVFSRDSLLSKIWGYDYYGGDRTVDVHIRRLRSKIEVSSHIFIETVRNVGYRFKKEA